MEKKKTRKRLLGVHIYQQGVLLIIQLENVALKCSDTETVPKKLRCLREFMFFLKRIKIVGESLWPLEAIATQPTEVPNEKNYLYF